jgi:peptidoglycan hydrolase-like protein with peptidoglycan-binding domain
MKKLIYAIIVSLFLSVSLVAQTDTTKTTTTETKTKRVVFRATKDQIMQAQKMLKVTESGRMDVETKAAVKKYQSENGLKQTGSLNRATLEKMNIQLTDKQKAIPVNPDSYTTTDENKTTTKKRGPVFRATKDQVMAAQKMLKDKGLYTGEATGTLDPPTRAGLKAYQEANGLKATGTLNAVTLEKMGIVLTDKQKENAAKTTQ